MSENNSLPAPAGNTYAASGAFKSSTTPPPDPFQQASQDDARWFSQNPRRSHRIRPPVPGEFPASVRRGLSRWVVVRRMAPGIRCRLSFASTATPPFTEEGAIRIFQRLMQIGAGTFKTEGCGNA